MWDRLEQIDKRYEEIMAQMVKPEVTSDRQKIMKLAQEKSAIDDVVALYRDYKTAARSLEETRSMQTDGHDVEMAALVKQEIHTLEEKLSKLEAELKLALLPKDPNDERNIILEIRAGTGGDEAALFASDLFRMYTRYAQAKRWDVDVVDTSESGGGGFK